MDGNTTIALNEMIKVFEKENIEVECFQIGNKVIRGCIACNSCYEKGKCIFEDEVNEIAKKFDESDGLIIASPVYFASANGTLISLLDRLFFSSHFNKSMKVGAAVVVARRGGCSSTFDEINKYFAKANMIIAGSQYWNSIHGLDKGEAEKDLEGLQTMRTLAQNISFLIKCIDDGKQKYGLPKYEETQHTNFIR